MLRRDETPMVFSGRAHSSLATDISEYLGIPKGECNVFKFSNDNTFVQFQENIRQRDIFLIQPFAYPVNDHIMELLIMIDAAKRASAGRITAVTPYYAYGRTDKKDQPRVPITARLVADLLSVAGADRVLTIDLHAGQIQGFFNIPVDELTALPILARYFQEKALENLVVVSVDIGISKRARDMAARLGVPLAIIEKRRVDNADNAESLNIIGDVEGMNVLTFDDEIDTRGIADVCRGGIAEGRGEGHLLLLHSPRPLRARRRQNSQQPHQGACGNGHPSGAGGEEERQGDRTVRCAPPGRGHSQDSRRPLSGSHVRIGDAVDNGKQDIRLSRGVQR